MTVLFADMVESTALGERLDPEALRGIQARYFTALREVVERHGGVVEKYIGDAVMAVFGVPAAHEDDALRAVRAASELSTSLAALGADLERRRGIRLELRTGVNTGPVIATDGDGAGTLVTGDTVNTAARLQQAAQPGEIVLGAMTYELVRDAVEAVELEPLALKGKSTEVRAYRLAAVTGTEGRVRRADTPFVGRTSELEVLESSLRRAIDERAPRLVTVFGTAGVGKSRLVREFVDSLAGRAEAVRGRCLSYGDGITYWPIVEILRGAAGILETDGADEIRGRLGKLAEGAPATDRLASVLAAIVGASDAEAVGDDVSWAVRRSFELIARRHPLVVIVEDIHWAEPALLDLLEAVVDWTSDAPLLLVCLARREILEVRPTWGSGARATNLGLEPLGASVAEHLLAVLPGGDAIPHSVRDRVLDVAEGNPLYLEELVAKLIDDGALDDGENGWAWTGDAKRIEIPATVTALVAARIDGLAPGEQRVAERASVVGRVFERGAVGALGPEGASGSIGGPLLALVRKQLIQPDGSGLDGDDAFRFRHIIIRDVAYERMPKAERAALHERFADWLESVLGERVAEYVEIVAHHLAEAVAYRVELDSLDGAGAGRLVDRAVGRLTEAAERAERLHTYGQAARLFARAASISGTADSASARVRDPAAAIDLERRAADADALAGDLEAALDRVRGLLDDVGDADPILRGRLLERLAAFAWDLGDEAGTFAAIEEASRLVPADPPSRDRAHVLAGHARFLMLTRRFDDSIPVCRAALEAAGAVGALTVRVSALVTLGTCFGNLGGESEGIAFLEEARQIATDIGDGPGFVRAGNNLGTIIRDRDLAEQVTIETIDRLPDLGLERSSSGVRLLINLAGGMLRSGRIVEAGAIVDRVLALEPTGDEGVDAMIWRGWLMTLRGRWGEARMALADARARVSRGPHFADLCWVEALEAIFEGRFDDASPLIRESRANEGDDAGPLIGLEWLELLVAVERASRARSAADVTDERESVGAARQSVARILDLAAGASDTVDLEFRHVLPHLTAELSRAEGTSDPDAWQAAADELRAERFLWDEAYALYRRAEALVDSGAPPIDSTEALETATHAAEGIGAGGLVTRLEELRARTGR